MLTKEEYAELTDLIFEIHQGCQCGSQAGTTIQRIKDFQAKATMEQVKMANASAAKRAEGRI